MRLKIFLVVMLLLTAGFTVLQVRALYLPPSGNWAGTQTWTNNYPGNCWLGIDSGSFGNTMVGGVVGCNGAGALYTQSVSLGGGGSDGGKRIAFFDWTPSTPCTTLCYTFYIPNFGQTTTSVDTSFDIYVLGSISAQVDGAFCSPFGCLGSARAAASFKAELDIIDTSGKVYYSDVVINDEVRCTPPTGSNCGTLVKSYSQDFSPSNCSGCSITGIAIPPGACFSLPCPISSYGHYQSKLEFTVQAASSASWPANGRAYSCFYYTSNCQALGVSPSSSCPGGIPTLNGQCLYVAWKWTQYTVHYPDFSISASPSSLSLNAGSSVSSTISLSSMNGLSNPVSLSATSDDPNLSFQFSSANPTPSPTSTASSTLTISDSNTCDSGAHTVTVTGVSYDKNTAYPTSSPPSISHSVSIPVSINRTCDFGISANPTSLSLRGGRTGSSLITLTSVSSFSGSVTLSATVTPPSGVSCATSSCPTTSFSVNPVSLTPNGSATSTLTISTARKTPTGIYTITVTGSSIYASHATTITVTVS